MYQTQIHEFRLQHDTSIQSLTKDYDQIKKKKSLLS